MIEHRTFYINQMSQYEGLLRSIELFIKTICDCPTEQGKVVFVTMEAINNALEHGRLPVQVDVEIKTTTVTFTIKDNGDGFPVLNKLKLINEKGADSLLEDCRSLTRGRGIYLMYVTAKEVLFNDMGNEVKLLIDKKAL